MLISVSLGYTKNITVCNQAALQLSCNIFVTFSGHTFKGVKQFTGGDIKYIYNSINSSTSDVMAIWTLQHENQ